MKLRARKEGGVLRLLVAGLVPLLLVSGAAWLFLKGGQAGARPLDPARTYAAWVREVEIGAGTGNLFVAVGVDGHRLLETPVVQNVMVAVWDPVHLKLTDVMGGEFSASGVQRVARFRPREGMQMVLGVYDHHLLKDNLLGAARLEVSQFREGVNILSEGQGVRRLELVIEPVERVGSTQLGPPSAVQTPWTMEPPPEFSRRSSEAVSGMPGLEQAGEEIRKTAEEVGDAVVKEVVPAVRQFGEEMTRTLEAFGGALKQPAKP